VALGDAKLKNSSPVLVRNFAKCRRIWGWSASAWRSPERPSCSMSDGLCMKTWYCKWVRDRVNDWISFCLPLFGHCIRFGRPKSNRYSMEIRSMKQLWDMGDPRPLLGFEGKFDAIKVLAWAWTFYCANCCICLIHFTVWPLVGCLTENFAHLGTISRGDGKLKLVAIYQHD